MDIIISALRTTNDLLTAGIAITAFSLLLYAMTFNLRDRVARSFAIILVCVVVVFVTEAISTTATTPGEMEFWLRLQWVGIIFIPPAYLHLSDALLETTGRPSRGRRRRTVYLLYLVSLLFLTSLLPGWLVGPLVQLDSPAAHLQRTNLTWIFSGFYSLTILLAWINFFRADKRTVTRTSRRRMRYLIIGALAPALGSFPFLLFGSEFAQNHQFVFWVAAVITNIAVSGLLVLMAYAVAFFGVSWPDRVVKRRLFKWLMRGPVTASTVLAITTIARRAGVAYGFPSPTAIPVLMVASVLILQHLITLLAPIWERWLFLGSDRQIQTIQNLEERLLTSDDLRDFLESILAAVCDRLQVSQAFLVSMGSEGLEMLLTIGNDNPFNEDNTSEDMLQAVNQNGRVGLKRADGERLFEWRNYWLVPLYAHHSMEAGFEDPHLLGFIGAARVPADPPDDEQVEALFLLASRATMALRDRLLQQQVFASLEALTPQVDLIQRLRAASRYDGTEVLTDPKTPFENQTITKWVKDALSHYWGGPKLSKSPLMHLDIVQQAVEEHQGNPTNALRAILRQAVERVRPDGERRFTGEWILYNILEMKFMEGRKVREIAMRLAMSEADLYRKQRVAIEAVANAILMMEQEMKEELLQNQQY
ncbi:MAG: histidine kinase N-terminal 7TM domain-containing protein [Anaerolineales bacterium]